MRLAQGTCQTGRLAVAAVGQRRRAQVGFSGRITALHLVGLRSDNAIRRRMLQHGFGAEFNQRPQLLGGGTVALEQQELRQAIQHHRVVAPFPLGEFQTGAFERTREGNDAFLPAIVLPDAVHVHAGAVQFGIAKEGEQRAGVFHRVVGPDAGRIGQAAVVGDDALEGLNRVFQHMELLQGERHVELAARGFPNAPGRARQPRPRHAARRVRQPRQRQCQARPPARPAGR